MVLTMIRQKNGKYKKEQNNTENRKNNDTLDFTDDDFDKRNSNIKLEESQIDLKIDEEISNAGRNTGAIVRGAGEIGGIVIKALPTAGAAAAEVGVEAAATVSRAVISGGLKVASWVLLPITCIAFGTWSLVNIHKDCHKILDIFDNAFTPFRFENLYGYIKSYRAAINYLELIGQKIINDDEKENE